MVVHLRGPIANACSVQGPDTITLRCEHSTMGFVTIYGSGRIHSATSTSIKRRQVVASALAAGWAYASAAVLRCTQTLLVYMHLSRVCPKSLAETSIAMHACARIFSDVPLCRTIGRVVTGATTAPNEQTIRAKKIGSSSKKSHDCRARAALSRFVPVLGPVPAWCNVLHVICSMSAGTYKRGTIRADPGGTLNFRFVHILNAVTSCSQVTRCHMECVLQLVVWMQRSR